MIYTRLAPAKINLMLHVTGREPSGFHALQSLFAFTTLADKIKITPHEHNVMEITGAFADAVSPEKNSLWSAQEWFYTQFPELRRSWSIHVTKRIPVAAGLGGGTSDAAAMIALLMEVHGLVIHDLKAFIISSGALGADVPVCLAYQLGLGSLFWLEGSGKAHYPCPIQRSLNHPVILINPLKASPTKDVFAALNPPYSHPIQLFLEVDDLLSWVSRQRNDLQEPASHLIPEIHEVLNLLSHLPGCRLARMSGSGATCFAFMDSDDNAPLLHELTKAYPQWWITQSFLV